MTVAYYFTQKSPPKIEVEPDVSNGLGKTDSSDHRETSDRYIGELFREDRHRVVVCHDGIQWILQKQRRADAAVGAAWDALGYFTTKNALLRVYRSKLAVSRQNYMLSPSRSGVHDGARSPQ